MKIKCCIIGLGFWGKIFLEKILKSSDFELVAVASASFRPSNSGRAQIFKTAGELLKHSDAEIIFILTSLDQHLSVAKLALQNGQNIFLTKPITANYKDAVALKNLARKNAVQIFVDHTFLFNHDFLKFKQLVSKQKIMGITSQRTQFGRFQKGSDVLGELLYHDIYMSMALMKGERPHSLKAIGQNTHGQMLDQCSLELSFAGDIRAELFASMNFIQKQKIMSAVTQSKIYSWQDMAPSILTEAKYKYANGQKGMLTSKKVEVLAVPPKPDAIELMLMHIADCLGQQKASHKRSHKRSQLIGIDQGIEVMKIIEAARRSVRSERRVKI